MKLVAAVESYIALRRSFGSVFAAESRILRNCSITPGKQ